MLPLATRRPSFLQKGVRTRRARYASNRRVSVPKVYRGPSNRATRNFTYKAKLELNVTVMASTTTSLGSYAFSFQLADLADSSSLKNVFDQYCFKSVTAIISPMGAQASPATTGNGFTPLLSVLDYDDATVLSTWQQGLNYANSLLHTFDAGEAVTRKFKPQAAIAMYTGSGTTYGGVTSGDQWIDSASDNVPHYGLKCLVRAASATFPQLQTFYIIFQYVLAFRNTR